MCLHTNYRVTLGKGKRKLKSTLALGVCAMYLSAKQIQKRLGVGHSSFYKHVARHLTSVRIGASVRYTVASVLAYEERISGKATTTPLAAVRKSL